MSEKRVDPAFPTQSEMLGYNAGMSLRDYFAASAVNGLMGRAWDSENNSGDEIVKMWATSAYAVADAMLAERAK